MSEAPGNAVSPGGLKVAMAACGSLMAAPYHTPFRLELARKGLAFARIADSMNVNDVDVDAHVNTDVDVHDNVEGDIVIQ